MKPLHDPSDPWPDGQALRAALHEFIVSRRTFLGAGVALALAGRTRAAAMLPRERRFATFINLRGGNDALNTLIPTRLPEYGSRRPTIAIAPEAGASLAAGPAPTTDYVLHPALANIARLYREGNVACVRLVGYPNPNQSHFLSQDIWSRGYRAARSADSGWIARFKDLYAPEPTGVVALGLGSQLDFLGGSTPSTHTLPGSNRSINYRFEGDRRYPANEVLRNQIVDRVLATPRAHPTAERARVAQVAANEQAKRLAGNPGGGRRRIEYPATDLGGKLEIAAGLLREDFPAAIYYSNHGDFDTHGGQGGVTGQHAAVLEMLDQAVDAYARDLRDAGAWSRAAIVVFSEFGRRNMQSASGTDHGEGGVMLLIGGAVRGGLYGPDLLGEHIAAAALPVAVDFRSVYEALLLRHFAVDPVPVFDEPFVRTPLELFA